MFTSLLEWCKFPINIHVRTGTKASGDPEFAVEHKGYQ